MIYFDSAASYPILPEALEELQVVFSKHAANPSSAHLLGEAAAQTIEQTREILADEIGALKSEIIFTSGATESNNLALKSHFYDLAARGDGHLVISSFEHKCIHAVADYLQRYAGICVSVAKPDKNGVVTRAAVERVLRDSTSLVSVMHLNNELGTVNPIKEIGELCFERGIMFHSDAAQSFMKLPIDVGDMNLDYLSMSAHKIGGPKGIGAVYVRDRRARNLEPVIHGAGQEEGVRGGTLPTALIASFGKAVKVFPAAYSELKSAQFKASLVAKLSTLNVPYQLNGESIDSLVSLTLPRTNVAALLRDTWEVFSLATGSACSSQNIEVSHVLASIGMQRELAERTLRVSFHHQNTPLEINQLAEKIAIYTSG